MKEDKEELIKQSAHKEDAPDPNPDKPGGGKRHLIKITWLRCVLKTIMWIIIGILLIPVMLYIPPVQTFVKNVACKVVKKSTGMEIGIDTFRLKFPLDISLRGVSVIEATGDTMVRAREAIVDVRLLPLLRLDVKLNKLKLMDGYYRMVSPDSSMVLGVRAGLLEADGNSGANIAQSAITLNKATLENGSLSLYMNVWKKKPTPPDSVQPATPFLIKANDLTLKNFDFSMSMLPTIDTLTLRANEVHLVGGVVDLGKNAITARTLAVTNGDFAYLTPTPEYVKTHPAPVDTISPPSPPMTISADSVSLSGFNVLYATKGVRPAPGFDPAYISLTGVEVALQNFFNEASEVRLPLKLLRGKERSGLTINSGTGLVAIDSIGLTLDNVNLATTYSKINATANVPFAMMALDPVSPMSCNLAASIGVPDIESFMPAVKPMTSKLGARNPLNVKLDAAGSLSLLRIPKLDVALPGVLSLRASGKAGNVLDFKKLYGSLDIDGELRNAAVANSLLGNIGFKIPTFKIRGNATVERMNYTADLDLVSEAGDVAADAKLGLNSEKYNADVRLRNLNVGWFAPGIGVGMITGNVRAAGAGFNPTKKGAALAAAVDIASVTYNHNLLHDITLRAKVDKGVYDLTVNSPNENADLDLVASGSIDGDNYTFDVDADVRNADLKALGLMQVECGGTLSATLTGTANPANWLYDADLKADKIIWSYDTQTINLPNGITVNFEALPGSVDAHIESLLTYVDFKSELGLKPTVDGFMAMTDSLMSQIDKRNLNVEILSEKMPNCTLDVNASGRGLVGMLMEDYGLSLDSIYARVAKDSLISANIGALSLNTGSLLIDTIKFDLSQRGDRFNYLAHIGNRPGVLDEFARVDARGYIGANRASIFLQQANIKGETGYRVGLTGAVTDSLASVHFTPINATIAYLPWKFNEDNHVDYALKSGRIDANLQASSNESSILMKTEPNEDGSEDFRFVLQNIKVQDFLKMSALAPPVKASVNTDLRVRYTGKGFSGGGTIDVNDLYYERLRVGNFNADLNASYDFAGRTSAEAILAVDGHKSLKAHTVLVNDSTGGMVPEDLGLTLTRFPVKVANAFLGPDVASLAGYLNGEMAMSGKFSAPRLNGYIACDSLKVKIPMMGTTLSLDTVPLDVNDNVVSFNDFDIYAVNSNPLTITGKVDATKFSDIGFDLTAKANNMQVVGNDKRAKSQIYGKLFIDLLAKVTGSTSRMNIDANADILGNTDIFYTLSTDPSSITTTSADEVVKFVNLSDTTLVQKADSLASTMVMRINANLNITPGTQATVNLATDGQSKVVVNPSGSLNFVRNYMGDMNLTGQLNTGSGLARYAVPIVGLKSLTIQPSSYVAFNGDIMNPVLNIHANDIEKVNVAQTSGNSRLVNFNISLAISNTLSQPRIVFDLSTDDDMTIQNELSSMSADQRSTQAMNIFLYGQYTGPGTKTLSAPTTSALYSFLTSNINKWAAQNIRGVDLSFGIDEYDKQVNGQNSTAMTYSYQVSKSLFNNKFKIVVGGNYSTDASADENFSQNLISDISFEYMIRQTNNVSMLVKLFRHTGYASILEGEVTETGVGFVMTRKLGFVGRLFKFGGRKQVDELIDSSSDSDRVQADSVKSVALEKDETSKDGASSSAKGTRVENVSKTQKQ